MAHLGCVCAVPLQEWQGRLGPWHLAALGLAQHWPCCWAWKPAASWIEYGLISSQDVLLQHRSPHGITSVLVGKADSALSPLSAPATLTPPSGLPPGPVSLGLRHGLGLDSFSSLPWPHG